MSKEKHNYPQADFSFEVKFNGGGVSGDGVFVDVSGLSAKMGNEEIGQATGGSFAYRLPKPASSENLVLKRGFLSESSVRKWVEKAIFELEVTPITVTINLLDRSGKPIVTWIAHNAWPLKWSVGEFDAQKNQLLVETFELAYDRLTVQK